MNDILVVGGGIFGVTAALTLRQRGHTVALLDPGPLPHPLAASTDISKVVRAAYGTDEQYTAMVEAAMPGWREWNSRWSQPLFHQTGALMVTHRPMQPGMFEYESYHLLQRQGHPLQRLDADEISRRFPAWRPGAFVDGFFDPQAGYTESGRVVAALVSEAQVASVTLYEEGVQELVQENGRVTGVRTTAGNTYPAGHVLAAAGSWTYLLVPALAPYMKASGHPVFHLRPAEPALFTPPHFPVFTGDIASTGWYGFPLHPREGVVKVANHGVGVQLHPAEDERVVTAEDEQRLRDFLRDTCPALADAPIVYTRRCLYADTLDEHLWIDHHPELDGLSVATGGSGHGFKFAPVLGGLIADMVERKENPWLAKFRWRALGEETAGEEAARHHG